MSPLARMSPLAERLAGKRVVVCAGAGGVGKTTISAAVALGLAAGGARVAVVTIDPARRLAEALGLERLGNEPRAVEPWRFARAGLPMEGELHAMMLDPKRTFDELIGRLAPNPWTRDEILANPIYAHLSTTVAGSQEYTAMAKLFELTREGGYDVVVLDTPPSRNAVDFLQAPDRLVGFLEGRALAAFMRPVAGTLRAASLVLAALRRIAGVGLLRDLTTFFRLLGDLLESFRTRAAEVQALLTDAGTAFVVVTSPERAALDEAVHLAAELRQAGMAHCATVVNRVHPLDRDFRGPEELARGLEPALGAPLARRVARTHADLQLLARRDAAELQRLQDALGEAPLLQLADRERDVHDLPALVDLRQELFAAPSGTRRARPRVHGRALA